MSLKSDILELMEGLLDSEKGLDRQVTAEVIDGPALLHQIHPGAAKIFAEYADKFGNSILQRLNVGNRVDIVWDD